MSIKWKVKSAKERAVSRGTACRAPTAVLLQKRGDFFGVAQGFVFACASAANEQEARQQRDACRKLNPRRQVAEARHAVGFRLTDQVLFQAAREAMRRLDDQQRPV